MGKYFLNNIKSSAYFFARRDSNLLTSPGFVFRQEGTNELSAVFHSMKIIPQKISLSNWVFYFNEMVSYFPYSILPGNIFRKHLLP